VNTTTDEKKWTPPYIAFRTLMNLIQRLRDEGLPPQLDRSFLTGSEGGKTQLLNALRAFELIGSNGEVLPKLEALVKAEPSERKRLIRGIFEERYPEPIRLGGINATQMQLEDAFRTYGVTGDTLRKAVAFFLKGAEYTGIPVSQHFRTPQVRRPGGTTRTRRQPPPGQQNNDTPPTQHTTSRMMTVSVPTALAGVLMKLPPNGPPWTEERREDFKRTFGMLLDFEYPVEGEYSEPDDEDEDYEE
jgi:hypothetical protein